MSRLLALLLVTGLLATGLLCLALRVAMPGDGAYLDNRKPWIAPDGVILTTYTENGALGDGDVVLAVDGRPVEDLADAIWRPAGLPETWRNGATVTYLVRRAGAPVEVEVQLAPHPLGTILRAFWSQMLFGVCMLALGAFVFARAPHDPAARLMFVFTTSSMVAGLNVLGLHVADLVSGTGFWLYQLSFLPPVFVFLASWLCFALRFPRTHPVAARYPTAVFGIAVLPTGLVALGAWLLWLTRDNALGWIRGVDGLWQAVSAVWIVLILVATISNFRYAAADPVARRKAKWVLLALIVFALGIGPAWQLPLALGGSPLLPHEVFQPIGMLIPVALAIAILRHNIFDVDLIFNRALVYGSLVGTLALLYWVSVVVLQQAFKVVGGELSDLAIVVSTLGIAGLLSPLRQRLQAIVDRRFDRAKYDAAKTLAAFSSSVRDEVDLEQLTGRLTAVVEETMQTNGVTVWLRKAS